MSEQPKCPKCGWKTWETYVWITTIVTAIYILGIIASGGGKAQDTNCHPAGKSSVCTKVTTTTR